MSSHIERYLPDKLAEIEEIAQACLAANPEFDSDSLKREKWVRNKSAREADIDGITVFEKIYGIKPSSQDSLEDRRLRVIAKMNENLPYTWIKLHDMVMALCGKDGYTMSLSDFVLTVKLAMESQSQLYSVVDMLSDVVPMHILLDITQRLDHTIDITALSYYLTHLNIHIGPDQERERTGYYVSPVLTYGIGRVSITVGPMIETYFSSQLNANFHAYAISKARVEVYSRG